MVRLTFRVQHFKDFLGFRYSFLLDEKSWRFRHDRLHQDNHSKREDATQDKHESPLNTILYTIEQDTGKETKDQGGPLQAACLLRSAMRGAERN